MRATATTGLAHYVTIFFWAYLLLNVIGLILFQMKLVHIGFGLTISLPVGAALMTGGTFIGNRRRPFTSREVTRLSLYSTLIVAASWVVKFALIFLLFAFVAWLDPERSASMAERLRDLLARLTIGKLLFVSAFASGLVYLAMLSVYGVLIGPIHALFSNHNRR